MHCLEPDNLWDLRGNASPQVVQALLRLSVKNNAELYLVGGTVRDWLLGRRSCDIDIAAPCSAASLAKQFRTELGGGSLVDLSGPDDEAVRVVWHNEQVDFASFRAGTTTIEEDLQCRDFTVNAMAVPLAALATDGEPLRLLDPTGGLADLREEKIRHCPGAFVADPLRMLRGYRLCATLGFHLVEKTRVEVRKHAARIAHAAAERIGYELRLIFASPRTALVLQTIAEDGLLARLLPELYQGAGVLQPEFHHLDVLGHSYLALSTMEEILADPQRYFPGRITEITKYLQQENALSCLKWAALLHDIGKPATREVQFGNDGRVTFYRHDEKGARIFRQFAERSRWSKAEIERTGGLIAMHMHPFHLCNVVREGEITRRAALKLCRRAGSDLSGLFLLAMADSMASRGEKKPERMEEELQELFDFVQKMYDDHIQPVLFGPRLLTGKDLIEEFALVPGPLFTKILDELEVARVEGEVTDRRTALAFVATYLKTDAANHPTSS
ncbi:MAG: HDIG domain-containing protein [Proteobacteria bacterium]|nr:HDIG domain-containing protein [Pseudomonadota bacterium]